MSAVTVVIPTNGRASLQRAVTSARAQRISSEILVIDNGVDGRRPAWLPSDVRYERSDHRAGANGARQAGIEMASSDLIALLDDDDWWLPEKLDVQLRHADEMGLLTADEWVSSHGIIRSSANSEVRSPRSFQPKDNFVSDVGDFLFTRRSFRDSFPQLQTSTLLFPRRLAMSVPWDTSVSRHQDWTWLLAVQAQGAKVAQAPFYLGKYGVSDSSISKSTAASESQHWGETYLLRITNPHVVGEFLLRVPLNMLLSASDPAGARNLLRYTLERYSPGRHSVVRSWLAITRSYTAQLKKTTR